MWWVDVIIVVVVAFGVYAFVTLARSRTRALSRRTDRTAENMYDEYADPPRKRRDER